MALYDSQINTENALPKVNENPIFFSDGGFYPYLKYLINQSTKIPNINIHIKDYGENSPFYQQDKTPKVYCELYQFNSPTITGRFYASGDMKIFAQCKYRIYFVNDNARSPFLFEAVLRGNIDGLEKVSKDFINTYKNSKIRFNIPLTITMSSRKEHQGYSTYPILIYDLLLNGYIEQNIRELESLPFDSMELGLILNKE